MSDPFVTSMTFASHDFRGQCDCDECGETTSGSNIPAPILAAVLQRKRQRLEMGPLKRTQKRSLVVRERGISIWNLIMPLHAEPLVEFGSSHRIVWVQRLPSSSSSSQQQQLWSIGKGIIGSSDEEKSRIELNWKEGEFYFVPSNGGKAVAWIHTGSGAAKKNESASSKNQSGSHAIFQIVKIPLDKLEEEKTTVEPSKLTEETSWISKMLVQCRKGLEDHKTTSEKQPYYKFLEADCNNLRAGFEQAKTKKDGADAPSQPAPIPTPQTENKSKK